MSVLATIGTSLLAKLFTSHLAALLVGWFAKAKAEAIKLAKLAEKEGKMAINVVETDAKKIGQAVSKAAGNL